MSTRLNRYLSIATCLFFFIVISCTTNHRGLDRLDTNEKGESHNFSTYDAGLDTFDDENLKKTGNTKSLEKAGWEQHHSGENRAINVSLSGSSNRAVIYPTAQKPGYNMYSQRAQDHDDDDDDDDDDYDDNDYHYGNVLFDDPTDAGRPSPSFQDDILPILTNRCAFAGCHVAGGPYRIDLRTYDCRRL